MATYRFQTSQKIPAGIGQVWEFISSPANLKLITPDHMGFEITSGEPEGKMYPGMIITYKVSPFRGIKMTWVTEITQVKEQEYFVDEQRVGPYSMWHHEHKIRTIKGGVEMTDIITYRPPLWFLGALANSLFIRKQLAGIFDYRREALVDIFGKFPSID